MVISPYARAAICLMCCVLCVGCADFESMSPEPTQEPINSRHAKTREIVRRLNKQVDEGTSVAKPYFRVRGNNVVVYTDDGTFNVSAPPSPQSPNTTARQTTTKDTHRITVRSDYFGVQSVTYDGKPVPRVEIGR